MARIILGESSAAFSAAPTVQQASQTVQQTAAAPAAALPPTVNFNSQIEQRAQEIANQLLEERVNALRRVNTGRIYTRFDEINDIVGNQKQLVTTGVWSNNVGTLSTFHTSSAASVSQKRYYYEVYNSESISETGQPQFAVAFGHRLGSGSSAQGNLNDSPSRAIYSQYKQLLLEPGDNTFTFANNVTGDSIYAINIARARLKEKLDPGNWQLNLAELSGSNVPNIYHTGSNVQLSGSDQVVQLIDDSGDADQSLSNLGQAGRIHNIVSGTIAGGIYKDGNNATHYYGLSYPDVGTLILNGTALDASASFNSVSSSNIEGDNAYKLFVAMSGSAAQNNTYGFTARNAETITSTHYFVRAKNAEYNFSNNPSFTTGSVGEFKQATFVNDPQVYITTVGLFNDRQELLAVAKLSQPIIKNFQSEVNVKIKLDF